ncbi:T-cell surface glycoprotein CD8 beta chain-like [Narcine bancroftii]|uniref:T-cell surface glycoprotein CD8 beta chain-like n=1 Tax=Narcine bancroftii TaxID=1343680 RepID=UPI00383154DB
MKFLGCIFILNCWIRGAQFQSILLQTPAKTIAAKGEKVEFSCTAKLSLGRLFWYKLDEDSASHFVISVDLMDNVRRGNGISSRFILISSTFRSSFSLVIKDVQLTDNGTYHCLMFSSQKTLMGGGSALTVVPEKQKVTSSPPTTKPLKMNRPRIPKWRNKKKKMNNEYACDWPFWGSLMACNFVLLISIIFVIMLRRRKHYQRRCPHQFRKR